MFTYSELKKGLKIILDNQPYEIIEFSPMFKGRGGSVAQTKLKNLIINNIIAKTFRPSDSFEEAEIQKIEIKFLYFHRDKFVFCEKNNPNKRIELTKEQINRTAQFLKQNEIVEGIVFNEKIINISLPIKIQLKVTEAPPGIQGNRSEAGTKTVILETGAKINTPLFIKEGDIIEVNTENGEYVKRLNTIS